MESTKQERTPFGERLVRARKERGLTQKQVEVQTGIAQSTIAQLELVGTSSGYTVSLALLYRVSPVWLALGEGAMSGITPAPEWLATLTDTELATVEAFARGLAASRGAQPGRVGEQPAAAASSPTMEKSGRRASVKKRT